MYDPLIVSVMDRVARDMAGEVEIYLDGRYRLGQPPARHSSGADEAVLRVLSRARRGRW
jgi:hypothetical protein